MEIIRPSTNTARGPALYERSKLFSALNTLRRKTDRNHYLQQKDEIGYTRRGTECTKVTAKIQSFRSERRIPISPRPRKPDKSLTQTSVQPPGATHLRPAQSAAPSVTNPGPRNRHGERARIRTCDRKSRLNFRRRYVGRGQRQLPARVDPRLQHVGVFLGVLVLPLTRVNA